MTIGICPATSQKISPKVWLIIGSNSIRVGACDHKSFIFHLYGKNLHSVLLENLMEIIVTKLSANELLGLFLQILNKPISVQHDVYFSSQF